MPFSCYESDASSCPTTPTSQESSQTPRTSRENSDAYYALLAENELLRNELKAIAERLEELDISQKGHHQVQSPKDWIRENLEEAQHLIDSIVGIKGITEDPLNAAIKMGISQPQPAPKSELKSELKPKPNPKPTGEEMFYESYQYYDHQKKQPQTQPQPRVSISSSIVPSNEELFGY